MNYLIVDDGSHKPVVGIPMEVAIAISGHKSIKVVQEYYRKVSVQEKKEAMKKLKFENLKAINR